MREKVTKLFTFDELSEKAKEKAIQNWMSTDYIYDGWWDFIYDNFREDAKKIGLDVETNEIEFNLDRGANFGIGRDGISVDDDYIKKELKLKKKPYVDIEFRVRKIGMQHQEFPRDRWFNSSENSNGWYVVHMEGVSEKDKPKVGELVEKMIGQLCELCSKSFDDLREEYKHVCSEEYVKDMIIANDYEFEEDGTRA